MPIVHPASDEARTPPYLTAMSRVDGCPECVTNYEAPYRVELEGESFTAYYRCADCQHLWVTAWGSY